MAEEILAKRPDRGKQLSFRPVWHHGEQFRRMVRETRDGRRWVMILCEPWQIRELKSGAWVASRRLA